MAAKITPISDKAPADVMLPRAPLVRVVAQVRFPPILTIRNPDYVAPFQEKIRARYPVLSEDRVANVAVSNSGIPEIVNVMIWRFYDRFPDWGWRVSLTSDFVAIETKTYAGRVDFLSRLEEVLIGVEKIFNPSSVQRVGLRYVNRLQSDSINNLHKLIKPKVLGVLSSDKDKPSSLHGAAMHMLTEAHLVAIEGIVKARWGMVGAGYTYDDDALEPRNEATWALDIDMSTELPSFKGQELANTAKKFAERLYWLFREMVTDEFLSFYGGKS